MVKAKTRTGRVAGAAATSGAPAHGFVRRAECVPDRTQRLSAEDAKATLAAKGWSNRALADWWGCRPEYISKIIHNPKRKRHFDDALRGLPPIEEVGEGGN